MQILKNLTTLLLFAVASVSAAPSEYLSGAVIENREDSIQKRNPTIGSELAFWNSRPGAPAGGLTVGLHLFKGTLPRDKSGDSKYSKLIVDGLDAAKANHHYLIGVTVADKSSGPPKKRVTTRDATVVAWDIGVKEGTADTMVLAKSSSKWSRTHSEDAAKVTYAYLRKAKSDKTPDISTIAKAYVADHPKYIADSNNCESFVDGVGKSG